MVVVMAGGGVRGSDGDGLFVHVVDAVDGAGGVRAGRVAGFGRFDSGRGDDAAVAGVATAAVFLVAMAWPLGEAADEGAGAGVLVIIRVLGRTVVVFRRNALDGADGHVGVRSGAVHDAAARRPTGLWLLHWGVVGTGQAGGLAEQLRALLNALEDGACARVLGVSSACIRRHAIIHGHCALWRAFKRSVL